MTELAKQIEAVTTVGELMHKGYNMTQISEMTGHSRATVKKYQDEFLQLVRNEAMSNSDLSRKMIDIMDAAEHRHQMLEKEAWETAEALEMNGDYKGKIQAMALIRGIIADRVGMFQKAGIDESIGLIEENTNLQRKQDIIVKILREVTYDCPRCKAEVAKRLSAVTEETEVIHVEVNEE